GGDRALAPAITRGERLRDVVTEAGISHLRTVTCWSYQPFVQLRPPPSSRDAAHRDRDSFLLADKHHQLLAARDARVEQVPLEHGVVLGHHRDDDGGILRALALVNRRRVGWH